MRPVSLTHRPWGDGRPPYPSQRQAGGPGAAQQVSGGLTGGGASGRHLVSLSAGDTHRAAEPLPLEYQDIAKLRRSPWTRKLGCLGCYPTRLPYTRVHPKPSCT